jgi:anti-anti-sigma regulatory factor
LYEDAHLRIIQGSPPEFLLLRGEIDIANSHAVAHALAEIQDQCGRVLVDTSGLRFIDVSGWRALTALHVRPPDRRPQFTSIAPCLRRMTKLMTDLSSSDRHSRSGGEGVQDGHHPQGKTAFP